MEEAEDETDIDIARNISDIKPRPEDKSVRQKMEMCTSDSDRQINIRDTTPTPENSPSRAESLKQKRIRFSENLK